MTETAFAPPAISLPALFAKFLRFGWLAFGGPVAQIAMIRHALVDEERWIDPPRFNRLLAVLQALPGPEAHELCVHLGIAARGRWGGLLAGVGFMLPGFVLMLLAGWGYAALVAGRAGFAAPLLGVQIVVIAVIARAVVRIGQHAIDAPLLWAVAGGSAALTLIGTPFWLPLLAGGLLAALASRPIFVASVVAAAALLVWLLHTSTSLGAVMPAPVSVSTAGLFIAGLKGGLLTFGGAYTAIPYVRGDTVGRGWLSDASFLDGVALANILPAPLVIFATFAGFVASGLAGALAITAGMFLPAFAFSMIFYERLEAVIENVALHRFLAGVAAAVVGVIAATCLQLGMATASRADPLWVAALIFAVALAAAWRWKKPVVVPALLLAGAAAGAVAFA